MTATYLEDQNYTYTLDDDRKVIIDFGPTRVVLKFRCSTGKTTVLVGSQKNDSWIETVHDLTYGSLRTSQAHPKPEFFLVDSDEDEDDDWDEEDDEDEE